MTTPDPSYNYGFGKYEDLTNISVALILPFFALFSLILFKDYTLKIQDFIANNTFALISAVCLQLLAIYKERLTALFFRNSNLNIFNKNSQKRGYFSKIEYLSVLAAILTYLSVNYMDAEFGFFTALFLSFALLVAYSSKPIQSVKRSIDRLLDKNLPENILYDFLSVVIENFEYMCEYKTMRTRQSGEDIFVEIEVVMPHDFTIAAARGLENKIKAELKEKYPEVTARIYAIPCTKNCDYREKGQCPVKIYQELKNASK
jgi:divalent metal cation (Fe/Co/Zn/Cd) transporter